jgi:hypothetical protein
MTLLLPAHLLESSPQWFPYFGNQRRFVPFVKELLVGLGAREGDTIFETNAGSHAISYHLAIEMGMHPIANDIGFYSCNIGTALSRQRTEASVLVAAKGAALIEKFGYNPPQDSIPDQLLVDKWKQFIREQIPAKNYRVIRDNLFDSLEQFQGKFIYCDFAWPWRDGTYTSEYETTADTLGKLLGDETLCTFKIASARRILQDVIAYLDAARKRYEFVILSNQSSNYPIPEVLEAHMVACGHSPIISRRQTVPAEHVDNLGNDLYFTEYQYVFEGRL